MQIMLYSGSAGFVMCIIVNMHMLSIAYNIVHVILYCTL